MCSAAPLPRTVIRAGSAGPLIELGELWRFRELLGFLAWRDLRVRYRQTLLGGVWAIIEPLINVLLFTLLFHRLAGLGSGDVPYPLFCYTATALWMYFSRSLRNTTVCLVTNAGLVTKVYFPRLALPLAGQLASLADYGCALVIYFGMLVWYGVTPGWPLLTLPVWVMLATLNALGLGLLLSAINVRYRDISQAVPFLAQVWMFATPVAYPLAAVPERWRALYLLNPMAGVVEGARWAMLPGYACHPALLLPGLIVGGLLLALGLRKFRDAQRYFADLI